MDGIGRDENTSVQTFWRVWDDASDLENKTQQAIGRFDGDPSYSVRKLRSTQLIFLVYYTTFL